MVKNVLSIDVEDWYHVLFVKDYLDNSLLRISIIEDAINEILVILEKVNVKATFFVLGDIADKFPDLCRKIHLHGHEIASHGHSHEVLFSLTKEQFRSDIKKSIQSINKATGVTPIGYRAPVGSIDKTNLWVFEELKEAGFLYDSSVYPSASFLTFAGVDGMPKEKHMVGDGLWEIPLSVAKFGFLNVPFSGGFYLRTLPFFLFKSFVKQLNKKNISTVLYVHPWEFNLDYPKIIKNPYHRFIQYHNLKSIKPRLEHLLAQFEFTSFKRLYFES